MPQGGDGGSRKRARSAMASVSSAPPEASTYASKPDARAVRRGGPLGHTLNANFRAALDWLSRHAGLGAATEVGLTGNSAGGGMGEKPGARAGSIQEGMMRKKRPSRPPASGVRTPHAPGAMERIFCVGRGTCRARPSRMSD